MSTGTESLGPNASLSHKDLKNPRFWPHWPKYQDRAWGWRL